MQKHMIKSLIALISAGALLIGSVHAQSSEPVDKPAKTKTKTKAKKKKVSGSTPRAKGGSVKFLPGSQETTKERSTRLMRECKGRVDAGACAGYAS